MSAPGRPKRERPLGGPVPEAPRGPHRSNASRAKRLLDDDQIGLEARVVDADHQALKVWLRLLACSTRFGMTLARFDYLAQLHRHPEGLRMSALSRYLMVTGGNVTALTDDLEKDGLVLREVDTEDRRSFKVALTAPGRKAFEKVAQIHESWVVELLSGLDADQKHQLQDLLGTLRVHLAQPGSKETP